MYCALKSIDYYAEGWGMSKKGFNEEIKKLNLSEDWK